MEGCFGSERRQKTKRSIAVQWMEHSSGKLSGHHHHHFPFQPFQTFAAAASEAAQWATGSGRSIDDIRW